MDMNDSLQMVSGLLDGMMAGTWKSLPSSLKVEFTEDFHKKREELMREKSKEELVQLREEFPELTQAGLSDNVLHAISFACRWDPNSIVSRGRVYELWLYVISPLIEKISTLERTNENLSQIIATLKPEGNDTEGTK